MRRFYAIEGGACRSLAPAAGAAPVDRPERQTFEPVHDIRLKDIKASRGKASLWPARRAIVVRHRSSAGLTISLTVPLRHYRGVSVDLAFSSAGEVNGARVILVHTDKALDVELFAACDDRDVIAEWRRWAGELGLPLLMRTPEGDEIASSTFGALSAAPVIQRRPPRHSSQRKPLVSRRRHVNGCADLPQFGGAREIIAYE